MNRWLLCVALLCLAGCKDDAPETTPETTTETAETTETAARAQAATPAKGEEAPAAKPVATRVPAAAAVLSAEHTAGFAGIEKVDVVARELMGHAELVAPSVLPPGQTLDQLVAGAIGQIGFDPRVTEGWAKVGLDPTAGIAVALDTRLWPAEGEPAPLVLAKVTDRTKLIETLRARGLQLTVGLPDTKGVAVVSGGDLTLLVGEKAGWTAALVLDGSAGVDALRSGFAAWLAAKGDLAEAGSPALAMPGDARVYLASFSKALAGKAAATGDEKLRAMFAFYAERFPAFSMAVTADLVTGSMRVVADEAAVKALRQILVPDVPSPALSRFIDPDHYAIATSLDPTNLFDGVIALIPPERADTRGQVLIGQNALPVALGVSQDDLAKAFTGHVVTAIDPQGLAAGAKPSLLMLGVGDQAVADRIVPLLIDKVAQQGGERAPTKFGEHAGHTLTMQGQTVFIVRVGDALLAGPERAALDAAIARSGGEAQAPALDGAGFFAFVMPTAAFEAMGANMPDPAVAAASQKLWTKVVGERLEGVMRIDDQGIVSDGPAAALLVGVSSAVAIPAFVRYTQRAQSSEAKITTRQIYQMAMMRQMEDKLPDSAPLTPPDDPCKAGGSSYTATATTWKHPTWVGLGFAPIGEQRYRYAFERTADGFVVRAIGDLDCDGVQSTYEMRATTGEDGMMVGTPSEIDPLE